MSITMVSVTIITNTLLRVVIGIAENVSSTIRFISSYSLFGKLCHTFKKSHVITHMYILSVCVKTIHT